MIKIIKGIKTIADLKKDLNRAIIDYKIELLNLKIQTLYDFEEQLPIIPEELTSNEDNNR